MQIRFKYSEKKIPTKNSLNHPDLVPRSHKKKTFEYQDQIFYVIPNFENYSFQKFQKIYQRLDSIHLDNISVIKAQKLPHWCFLYVFCIYSTKIVL